MRKRTILLICLLVGVAVLVWVNQIEKEIFSTEITPDDEGLSVPSIFSDIEPALEDWRFEEIDAFFVEYRLQRDRVRGQEMELLKDFIDNENTTSEGKVRAEEQLLTLIEVMEKELLVENLVKAQGFEDAIFFYKEEKAHLVLKAEDLSQAQFVQLTEMVASVASISKEKVIIIENPSR